MGLNFLNKKKVHTGKFSNMEEVWKAEKKYLERQKQIVEREKKLKEERQKEEINQLKVDAGLLPEGHVERLDWIYEVKENKKEETNTEDFFKKALEEKEKLKKLSNNTSSLNTNDFQSKYTISKKDLVDKIQQDPLYLIKKEEEKQRKENEENPYKMKMFLKEIEDELLKEEKKEQKRKEKKEKKEKRNENEERRDDCHRSKTYSSNFKPESNYSDSNNKYYSKSFHDSYTISKKNEFRIENKTGKYNEYLKEKELFFNNNLKQEKENERNENTKHYGLIVGNKQINNLSSEKNSNNFTPDLSIWEKKQKIKEELDKFKTRNNK